MKVGKVMALVLTMATFFSVAQEAVAQQATYTLKLGHVDSESTNLHQSALMLSRLVKEATNGDVVIQVFANSLLGGERDLLEGLQFGTLDMAATTTAPMSNFVKEFMIFDAPFLYRDDQHAFNVADGEVGEALNKKMLDQQGIHILGYQSVGYRELFAVKPIATLEDLAGVKIRTMENVLHMAAFSSMKAIPSPMPYGELYTGLQQKTVDAAEGGLKAAIVDMKFYEVAPNITLFGYVYCMKAFVISDQSWNKLPEQYRTIIAEKAAEAVTWQRETAVRENKEALETLRQLGCTIYEPDRQPFIEACSVVYDEFADSLPADLLEKIRKTPSTK